MQSLLSKEFPVFRWALVAAGSICLSFFLANSRETQQPSPVPAGRAFLQGYAFEGASGASASRNLSRKDSTAVAEYRVKNFNNDPIQVGFSIPVARLEEYRKEYGYTQSELDNLNDWQRKALKDAYDQAVNNGLSQAELDKMSADIKAEYPKKIENLMTSRGLKYKSKGLLVPDIPGIVRRNVGNMGPVAKDIDNVAKARSYAALDIVGAALSLVQTGLEYERVPLKEKERTIGGVYPPVVAMIEGRGDCDTKTAVMASILLNWEKMRLIGVGIPNHYLIGILQIPAKGDAYVEYRGLYYTLMEPAGPGWSPPGMVSDYTLDLLKAGDSIALEPMQIN